MPKKSLAPVSVKVDPNRQLKSRKKFRKKKTAKRKHPDGHDDLVSQLNARYGKLRKNDDEVSIATINPTAHPSSYNRLMSRAVETQLNRLTQPEQPNDLISTSWLCALCQNRSCFDSLGDLHGPYYERLFHGCHIPKFLIETAKFKSQNEVCATSITRKKTQTVESVTSKKIKNATISEESTDFTCSNEGHVDLWMHGNCSYWAPELFLIGGRFPGLLKFLTKYWSQQCIVCSKLGASIELKDGSFLHYPCAVEKGYRLNVLTLTCLPPKD